MAEPKALLISLRDGSDPMADHERCCFADASQLDVASIDVHNLVLGPPDRLAPYDAIFFGGSGAYSVLDDAPWIQRGVEVMLEVAELRIPAWASCFGFQGLAVALGGQVVHDLDRREMGSTRLRLTDAGVNDPLLSVLPRDFWAQEGHKDRVVNIPNGVTMLATGDTVEAQAFKVDGAPFWASQFHPELTLRGTLERFRYYSRQYLGDADPASTLRRLEAGEETVEMSQVLARLVRGEFSS